MKILIDSKTAAATSDPVKVHEGQGYNYPGFPVTIWAWDLASGETVKIQFPTDKSGDDSWEDMYILTPGTQQVAIYAPVEFRVAKSATATDAGVAMSYVRGL